MMSIHRTGVLWVVSLLALASADAGIRVSGPQRLVLQPGRVFVFTDNRPEAQGVHVAKIGDDLIRIPNAHPLAAAPPVVIDTDHPALKRLLAKARALVPSGDAQRTVLAAIELVKRSGPDGRSLAITETPKAVFHGLTRPVSLGAYLARGRVDERELTLLTQLVLQELDLEARLVAASRLYNAGNRGFADYRYVPELYIEVTQRVASGAVARRLRVSPRYMSVVIIRGDGKVRPQHDNRYGPTLSLSRLRPGTPVVSPP